VRPYEIAARHHLAEGRLKIVLQEWSCTRDPVWAAYAKSRRLPAKVQAFVDFAQRVLADRDGVVTPG
jgi:DNA-binding transcriptional LysR family regulator